MSQPCATTLRVGIFNARYIVFLERSDHFDEFDPLNLPRDAVVCYHQSTLVKATTLDVDRARVGRLKAALEARAVYEEVFKYCRAELLSENYFHAVFESTKGIAARIRNLSGLNGDGADLVTEVFLGQSPMLALGPLDS